MNTCDPSPLGREDGKAHTPRRSSSNTSQELQLAAALSVRRVTSRTTRVDLSGQQLLPYLKNALQRTVLALHGRPVTFLTGRIRVSQVVTKRDSYVNSLLIQSRGTAAAPRCSSCVKKMVRDPDGLASPYPDCIRLPGHFGGCCGNCKWSDHGARCSERDRVVNTWVPVPDRIEEAPVASENHPSSPQSAAGSRSDDPILIESDTDDDPSSFAGSEPPFMRDESAASADAARDGEIDDGAMDPTLDGGVASAGTAEDPIQLD